MKVTPSKSKTPTKMYIYLQQRQSKAPQQQTADTVYKSCMKILTTQTQQEISKYLISNKLTSFALKSQKCLHILNVTLQTFKTMMVENQNSSSYLIRIINNYKKNYRKAEEFCRLLKHFAEKDYEFQFIQEVAKCENAESIGFYIKCHNIIIDSFLNKTKKELLANVYGNEEQWYKIAEKMFKEVRREHLIELFTDVIKYHYQNIKKNQNEELNGAEIFRIFQIMNRNLKEAKNSQLYSFNEKDEPYLAASRSQERDPEQNTMRSKEKQVRRLFDKSVVDGLESQDRQLIRILSYKDQNIAKLLEKKHEKMIELIAEDVQNMRKSIQTEKEKYLQLWKQKQDIIRAADFLNYLSLNYIANDSADNEQKLIRAIEAFNAKHKQNSDTVVQARKMREARKNRRLIELIEKEEREKC